MKKTSANHDIDRLRLERKINRAIEENSSISSYTSEKIKNIYKFLESSAGSEIETISNSSSQFNFEGEKENLSENTRKAPSSNSKNYNKNVEKAPTKDEINYSSASRAKQIESERALEELQARVLFLERELSESQEKTQKVQLQLESSERQRAFEAKHAANNKNGSNTEELQRLSEENKKLEESLKKNMEFLDEVIRDKQALNEQVAALAADKANYDKKKQAEIEEIKEKYTKELKANKDAWLTAEKARKEKWLQEKTQEIKNLTIKGLEPEIERIISRNKLEIKRLEEKQQKEIEKVFYLYNF